MIIRVTVRVFVFLFCYLLNGLIFRNENFFL